MTTWMSLLLTMALGLDTPTPAPSAPAATPAPVEAVTPWELAPQPPDVPLPDFETPVDYLAWYRRATAYADGDNALTYYGVFLYGDDEAEAAALSPKADSAAGEALEKLLKSPEPWYPRDHVALVNWMMGIESRYAHVLEGGAAYHHYATRLSVYRELLADQTPPALGNARALGQLLIARAWRIEDGSLDADRLPDSLKSNLILAYQIGQGATLEEMFFAAGHRTFVYREISRSLASPMHTVYQWNELADALETYDAVSIPRELAHGLYYLEASAQQLLQYFCTTSDAEGAAQVAPKINMDAVNSYAESKYPGGRFRPAGVEKLEQADPRALAKVIHDYFEGMRRLLREPVARDLGEKVTALEKETIGAHPELGLIVTPIGLPVQAAFRTEAQRRLAYLFLKQAIVFKQTGEWPESLDDLKGPRVATSRIDPFTGKDMGLLAVDKVRIPYSVGPDGVDDGGTDPQDILYWGRVAPEAYLHQNEHKPKDATEDASSNGASATPAPASQGEHGDDAGKPKDAKQPASPATPK